MSEAEMLESIKEDVAIIREVLLGNGNTGKSVVVRLATLEQREIMRLDKKSVASIVCALIMSVGAIIVSLIT